MRAATFVQVLQDLFCFIACFILLVIAPLELGDTDVPGMEK